ncbi:DEAD/DEAH box helicase [Hymenobacter sp. 102]|uniref:DEAD/DEAH box helicase n=1 Tax=Hymenobacter sp. 102 TaxID=3403152 RepID=UPI003CE6A596
MQTTELLTYLEREKALVEADIRQIDALGLPERVQRGLAVVNLRVLRQEGVEVLLACEENLTRWKPGDWVEISLDGHWSTATIAENGFSEILVLLHTYFDVRPDTQIVLQSNKSQLLDPIIQAVRRLEPGAPGAAFLDLLWGVRKINPQQFGGLELSEAQLAAVAGQLNESQRGVVRRGVRRPSLLAVQGPPGTGKTHVLALTAQQLARKKQRIVVLAHTHQAVNNCLNAIRALDSQLSVFKIGEVLKAEGLDESIPSLPYAEFQRLYKQKKRPEFCVIGMSYYAALVHLGLRATGFAPTVVLVDEAGQIPLTYGLAVGSLGAGSVLLFGDDAQMPPIYHPDLVSDPLSRSLFEQVRQLQPEAVVALDTTYRLNAPLSSLIGTLYYRNADTPTSFLKSAPAAQGHRLRLALPATTPAPIVRVLRPDASLVWVNNATEEACAQENLPEAQAVAELVATSLAAGLPAREIAVVAPFRRQVLAIRQALRLRLDTVPKELIVDTVERVQGASVELILVSFAANSPEYLRLVRRFLLLPNRLNVALSRARAKSVFFVSDALLELPPADALRSQLAYLRESSDEYLPLSELHNLPDPT